MMLDWGCSMQKYAPRAVAKANKIAILATHVLAALTEGKCEAPKGQILDLREVPLLIQIHVERGIPATINPLGLSPRRSCTAKVKPWTVWMSWKALSLISNVALVLSTMLREPRVTNRQEP